MLLKQLLKNLDYTLVQGCLNTEVTDIYYDSRKVTPGGLFVCIVGTPRDSHDYAADVAAKGAAVLAIQHDLPAEVLAALPDVTVVKFENTRYAMALPSTAYFGRPALEMTMVGVTGTKGKTTTTHMIKSVLEAAGRKVGSQAVIANAWHHRSDALSSLGTLVGIACAYFLGQKWRIADPIAALVVAVFLFKVDIDLVRTGRNELLERSLPADVEEESLRIVTTDPEVCQPHNLRTRRIGAAIADEEHVRKGGAMTVARSHALTVDIERRLRARFGEGTMIAIHVEPLK